MKNLNEPLRRTPSEDEPLSRTPEDERLRRNASEGEVISLESRRNAVPTKQPGLKGDIEDLRLQWTAIQASFVDEPRQSVEKAEQLVSSAIKRLTDDLQAKRSEVADRLNKKDVSTEDLRTSLQQYHALFDKLLGF
jgi:hypothetical protein